MDYKSYQNHNPKTFSSKDITNPKVNKTDQKFSGQSQNQKEVKKTPEPFGTLSSDLEH